MMYYTPVPIEEHDALLGVDFNKRFTKEMQDYYAPYQRKNRTICIGKETWEYATADSIPGGEWVGAGKNVIDVKAPGIEIDVKGISINKISKGYTTEASVLQNNKSGTDNFMKLFKDKDFNALKTMYVDSFVNKVQSTTNLHVLCSVREKSTKSVHYCLLKVEEKQNDTFIEEMGVSGSRTVDIPMMDPEFGKVYLYIPKRRLELRLNYPGMSKYTVYSHSI